MNGQKKLIVELFTALEHVTKTHPGASGNKCPICMLALLAVADGLPAMLEEYDARGPGH